MEKGGNVFRLKRLWILCIRFLTPVLVGIVTISGLISVYGVVFQ